MKKSPFLSFVCFALLLGPHKQAYAQNTLPQIEPVGNVIVKAESIESVVKGIVTRALKGGLTQPKLGFRDEVIKQSILLKKRDGSSLDEVLKILGIQRTLNLEMAAVKAEIDLPSTGLKISVKNVSNNRFDVTAAWSVSTLRLTTDQVSIKVPRGLFPKPFEVISKPVVMGLKSNSIPISFKLQFSAELSMSGIKLAMQNFQTNIASKKSPELFVTLGQLTVDGQPLELEIQSNGKSLLAKEKEIRKLFQTLEPDIVDSLRSKIESSIKEEITTAAKKIESEPPFKVTLNSSELIKDIPNINPALKTLVSGIEANLLVSYLEFIKNSNLFVAQIGSQICFDNQCPAPINPPTPISTRDLDLIRKNDGGSVILYESLLQNLISNSAFQRRIRTYYANSSSSKGVTLAKNGVAMTFDPTQNSILAILNLEIDIKKTIDKGSSWGERFRLYLGDLIENYFGTGSIVKVPIEIKFKILGIKMSNETKKPTLYITTELPFKADGEYIPPKTCKTKAQCPSNVSDLTGMVRDGFFESVRTELEESFPQLISIPVGGVIAFRDFEFTPSQVVITPNRGLLISGSIIDQFGDAP